MARYQSMYNDNGDLSYNKTTKNHWILLEKDLTAFVRGIPQYVRCAPPSFSSQDWMVISFCRAKAAGATWVGIEVSDGPRGTRKVITKKDVPTKVDSVTSGGIKKKIVDGTVIQKQVIVPYEAVNVTHEIRNAQHQRQGLEDKIQSAQTQLENWNDPDYVDTWVMQQKAQLEQSILNQEASMAGSADQEAKSRERWDELADEYLDIPKGEPMPIPNMNAWLNHYFNSVATPVPQ